MSIAEKLTTIAQNEQTIYNNVNTETQLLDDLQEIVDNLPEAGSGGGDNHYDTFWDAYQENGNRYEYQYAFYSSWWTDDAYNPKYPIHATSGNGINSMFMNNLSVTDTKVPIVVGADGAKRTATQAFNNCQKLKIICSLDLTNASAAVNAFYRCYALEEIRLVGSVSVSLSFTDSSKLSDASIQSIIDHLKDLTGSTAQTLTLHATVGAKLTQTQKDAIAAKNWTLVY